MYKTESTEAVRTWASHHHLPVQSAIQQWTEFLDQHWSMHSAALSQQQQFDHRSVILARDYVKHLVVHNEDHSTFQFNLYCPLVYYDLILTTFHRSKIFQKSILTPTQANAAVTATLPKQLRKYRWVLPTQSKLPYGYIFCKRKKAYTNARPVISFYKCTFEKLLKVTAAALSDIANRMFKETFHIDTIPQTFKRLHRFYTSTSDIHDYLFFNDDLSGFYTSVPQDRMPPQ